MHQTWAWHFLCRTWATFRTRKHLKPRNGCRCLIALERWFKSLRTWWRHWTTSWKIIVLEYLYGKEIYAVLWSAEPRPTIEKVLNDFIVSVSEPIPLDDDEETRSSDNFQPRILEPLVIYLNNDVVEEVSETFSESNKSLEDKLEAAKLSEIERDSAASVNSRRDTMQSSRISETQLSTSKVGEDDKRPKLIIPPVWTPANQEGNAMFMFTFFRNVGWDVKVDSTISLFASLFFSNLNISYHQSMSLNHRTSAWFSPQRSIMKSSHYATITLKIFSLSDFLTATILAMPNWSGKILKLSISCRRMKLRKSSWKLQNERVIYHWCWQTSIHYMWVRTQRRVV